MSVPATPDQQQSIAQRILPPYALNPDRKDARLRRRIGFASLIIFCTLEGMVYSLFGFYLLTLLIFPIVILSAFVIWALPESKAPPVRFIKPFFFSFMFVLVLWPNYLAIVPPGFPWITAERLTGLPLAFFVVVTLSMSKSFRSQIYTALKRTPVIFYMYLAFIAVQIISIPFSSQISLSINKFIVQQIDWTIVFVSAIYLFEDERLITKYFLMNLFIVGALCFIGVGELRAQQILWAGHIPSFLQVEDQNVAMTLRGGHRLSGDYRIQTTFGNPIGMGEYVALTIPFVYHLWAQSFARPIRLAAGLSVPLVFFVTFETHARSGVVGLLISSLAYGFYLGYKNWKRGNNIVGASIVFGYPIISLMALASTFVVGSVHKAVWGGGAEQYSSQARADQWKMGMPKILARPLGHGIGTRGEVLGYFDPSGILTIDSYFLGTLLEYGFIGFAVFYGIFAYAAYRGGKIIYENKTISLEQSFIVPATIALVNFIVIKSVYAQDDNHPLVYVLLGLMVVVVGKLSTNAPAPSTPIQPARTRRPPQGLRR